VAASTLSFQRRQDPALQRLLTGLVLALVLHAGTAGTLAWLMTLGLLSSPKPPQAPEHVALVNVSAAQWSANRVVGSTPAPRPVISRTEPRHEALPRGQIVDVAAGNDRQPASSKYLADHDNTVARETRAREQSAFYAQAAPQRSTTRVSKPHIEKREVAAKPSETVAQTARQKVELAPAAPEGELVSAEERRAREGNSSRLKLRLGSLWDGADEGGAQESTPPEEEPGAEGKLAAQSGAAPNDRLDAPEGDGTFLNTRQFRYASFFNRVKQCVGQRWKGDEALHQRDPTGSHYGREDRQAVLAITIDTHGRMVDVAVIRSSGLPFFDDEAVAAFERAQPFPNPPTALFDGRETFSFTFGFFLDMTSSGLRWLPASR
jgi:TonB family protein